MKNLGNLLYSIVLKLLCKHVMCINYRYESIMCDIFMMIREMEGLGSWSSLLRHTICLLKSRLLLARVIRWPHLSLQRVHLRLFVRFHWIVLQAAPSWWWMIAEVWGGGTALEIGNITINVGTPELNSSFTTNSEMLIEPFTFTLSLKNYASVRLLTKLFKLIITIMYLC